MILYTYDDIEQHGGWWCYYSMGLECSPEFVSLNNPEVLKLANGMGAKGSFLNIFIPDTVYGVDISLISVDHDVGYAKERDRKTVDERFYRNGCIIIKRESSNWFMAFLRRRRLKKYYKLLRLLGEKAWKAGHATT